MPRPLPAPPQMGRRLPGGSRCASAGVWELPGAPSSRGTTLQPLPFRGALSRLLLRVSLAPHPGCAPPARVRPRRRPPPSQRIFSPPPPAAQPRPLPPLFPSAGTSPGLAAGRGPAAAAEGAGGGRGRRGAGGSPLRGSTLHGAAR